MDTLEFLRQIKEEDLDELLKNSGIITDSILLEDGIINNDNGVSKNGKTLLKHKIIDFKVYLSNNTKIEPIFKLVTAKKEYTGHFIDIEKSLYNEGEVKTRQIAKELLEILKFNNENRFFTRNDGGYLNLEDLPTEKPELNINNELKNFINSLDNSQAYALKQLILYGFVNIIRDKAIKPRGIIKSAILYGAKYSGKTLITNFVRNMFNEERIGFGDGGSPQSATALRNSLASNIGIVICDECDAKMVNKKRRTLYNDIEAIIKGIYQKQLPKTSDLNNQGYLLQQEQIGIPVLTMNDKINLTEALKDRVIAIEFDNSEELPILDLEQIKPELLAFGKAIAYIFGKTWNTLKKYDNNDEIINRILLEMENEYDIDLSILINSEYCTENTTEKITDCINRYIIQKLDYHIKGNDIDTAFFSNWVKIPWIANVTTDTVIIKQKEFYDFVKSNDCLNDGGISSQRIGERLFEETNIKPENKVRKINGKSERTISYTYNDFMKIFNLIIKEEEEE